MGGLAFVISLRSVGSFAKGQPSRFGRRAVRLGGERRVGGSETRARKLLPEAEFRDQLAVTAHILAPQVVEQPPPPTHHLQQSAARVMVLRVLAEVVGETGDPGGEQRRLNLRRTGVGVVTPELLDDLLFLLWGQCQWVRFLWAGGMACRGLRSLLLGVLPLRNPLPPFAGRLRRGSRPLRVFRVGFLLTGEP